MKIDCFHKIVPFVESTQNNSSGSEPTNTLSPTTMGDELEQAGRAHFQMMFWPVR
jgi:hypothetical protein